MQKPRSVYRRGADDGLVMGPLLAVTVVLFGMVTSAKLWAFPLFAAAFLAVPVLLYIQLRRSYAEDAGTSTFSALWLHGICTFFFGSLIMALVVYVLLRFAAPDFIQEQFRTVLELYSASDQPEARELAAKLDLLARNGQLPSAIDVALEMIYAGVFTGSMLSMLMSGLVRLRGSRRHGHGA